VDNKRFVVTDGGPSLTQLARQARETGEPVVAQYGDHLYRIDGNCPSCEKPFETAFLDRDTAENANVVPLWRFRHAGGTTCKSALTLRILLGLPRHEVASVDEVPLQGDVDAREWLASVDGILFRIHATGRSGIGNRAASEGLIRWRLKKVIGRALVSAPEKRPGEEYSIWLEQPDPEAPGA